LSEAKPGSGGEIRNVVPDFASLNPGYDDYDYDVRRADRDWSGPPLPERSDEDRSYGGIFGNGLLDSSGAEASRERICLRHCERKRSNPGPLVMTVRSLWIASSLARLAMTRRRRNEIDTLPAGAGMTPEGSAPPYDVCAPGADAA
jgi:hypothetical protein